MKKEIFYADSIDMYGNAEAFGLKQEEMEIILKRKKRD